MIKLWHKTTDLITLAAADLTADILLCHTYNISRSIPSISRTIPHRTSIMTINDSCFQQLPTSRDNLARITPHPIPCPTIRNLLHSPFRIPKGSCKRTPRDLGYSHVILLPAPFPKSSIQLMMPHAGRKMMILVCWVCWSLPKKGNRIAAMQKRSKKRNSSWKESRRHRTRINRGRTRGGHWCTWERKWGSTMRSYRCSSLPTMARIIMAMVSWQQHQHCTIIFPWCIMPITIWQDWCRKIVPLTIPNNPLPFQKTTTTTTISTTLNCKRINSSKTKEGTSYSNPSPPLKATFRTRPYRHFNL